MIKPIQIRSHSFTQISRGAYKASDVDEYLSEVASQLEEHLAEREQLVKKITMLADKIQEYRDDEDSIGAALLNAQKMAAKLTKDAEDVADELNSKAEQQAKELETRAIEKAREIISAANDKSEQMVAEDKKQHDAIVNSTDKDARAQLVATKKELSAKTRELKALKAKVEQLKSRALDMYTSHIAEIKELSSIVEKEDEAYEAEEATAETVVAQEAVVEASEEIKANDTVEAAVEAAVAAAEKVEAETANEITVEAPEASEEIAAEAIVEEPQGFVVSEDVFSDVKSEATADSENEEPDFASFKVNLENLTDGGNTDFFSFFTDRNDK